MPTLCEVKAHHLVSWGEESSVDGHVRRGTGVCLDIDTPVFTGEPVSLKSSLVRQSLNGIDVLITSVIPSTGIAL